MTNTNIPGGLLVFSGRSKRAKKQQAKSYSRQREQRLDTFFQPQLTQSNEHINRSLAMTLGSLLIALVLHRHRS